jgi:hypothetical protein
MVTVFLRGGLGNQMFQYALGLDLAKKNNAPLVLDTVYLRDRFPRPNFAYRNYDLDVFNLDAHFTPLSRAANALPMPGVWLALDLAGIAARRALGMQKMIKEKKEHEFDPAVATARGNIFLWGRWQNGKYFKDSEEDVRRAFTFRAPLEGEAKKIAAQIDAAASSVSLHVRRGDYAAFKNVEKLHGKTDVPYYARAAAYVASRVKDPRFFVFSDDIPWCKENLKLDLPVTFVEGSAAGPHDAFHFELMARCKHNIITNSTYSWWAAWLNRNPAKVIVAPQRWYLDPKMDEADMIPAGWVRL